ncbi:hypothetical protein AGDE_06203 [Angomonas deanei]|nr:hypothetical protein AGDE_06203 [Angomonas deanei]|eukprot:EPY37731.1 hypothetical protein AGDE_06203 [Angomonas deanei]
MRLLNIILLLQWRSVLSVVTLVEFLLFRLSHHPPLPRFRVLSQKGAMKRTLLFRLKVEDSSARQNLFTKAGPSRPRRFNFNTEKRPLGAPVGDSSDNSSIPSSRGLTRPVYEGQRQRYKRHQQSQTTSDVPGSFFTPISSKHGLYGGIDSHGLEPATVSSEDRRRRLQAALEENAASAVEFTEGGENDIDLNGLPESEYHGKEGWTTIPKDSALYSSLYSGELDSRRRHNSWSLIQKTREGFFHRNDGEGEMKLDDQHRKKLHDDGSYSNLLENELLEPVSEMISQPRSTYGMRKMFVSGLLGYAGVVSRAEEATICQELLHLLQDRRAAYIAEESRYCVNLYEKELRTAGGKDALAFSMSHAPTLQKVLQRFFLLGLIPSPPNVCQISEMVGNFSGYPVHRKPPSIGSYCGMLNLVSTSVLHLQHVECPWFPRVYLHPRSLYVVTSPCLEEYAMGYKQTHQPFHNFEYATRISKDYRIEVLFATVEVEHHKNLHQAVQLSDYVEQKTQKQLESGGGEKVPQMGATDEWIAKLTDSVRSSEGNSVHLTDSPFTTDGNKLREQLLRGGAVGGTARQFDTATTDHTKSVSQRKIAALKARYDLGKKMSTPSVGKESTGPRLIRGHSPKDTKR